MRYKTEFQTLRIADITPAPYNPREDIAPGTKEYESLRRSIEEHGMVEPPVVNLVNMRCIGGNQRLAVLKDMGCTDVLCSVIRQPDETQEKKLCLALNQINGRWDTDLLGDLLRDDDVLEYETGFDAEEVALYRRLEQVREPEEELEEEYEPGPDDDDGDYDGPEEAPEAPSLSDSSTLIRVGHLHFRANVSDYQRLLESIRDKGIFDKAGICAEIKRRLLAND